MKIKKIKGVIDAVHYLTNGKIGFVRLYERRGAVWSDHLIVNRDDLVASIRTGNKYATGKRKNYLGSSLVIDSEIMINHDWISTEDNISACDQLLGVPMI